MIDRLCDRVDGGTAAVACVYCDFHAQNEQSTAELLGVLLKQVLSPLESSRDEVNTVFDNSQRGVGGRRLLLPDILEMFIKSCRERVFICIDALDEFPAKRRPELWESLSQIVQRCPKTRLFLTGRLHIREEVQKYFPTRAEMLQISPRDRDIRLYLTMRLSQAPEPDALDEELKAEILTTVPEVATRT